MLLGMKQKKTLIVRQKTVIFNTNTGTVLVVKRKYCSRQQKFKTRPSFVKIINYLLKIFFANHFNQTFLIKLYSKSTTKDVR